MPETFNPRILRADATNVHCSPLTGTRATRKVGLQRVRTTRALKFETFSTMFRLGSLIFRNILRNRRRTILTLASTAVSLGLLALLTAICQGFFYGEPATASEAQRLICRHRVSLTQSLPASHFQRIKSMEGVQEVSAWTWFQGKYKEPKNFFARLAVDANAVAPSPETNEAKRTEKSLRVKRLDIMACSSFL